MSSRTSYRSIKAAKPCRRVKREGAQRVTAALEAVLSSATKIRDPIMEQLKQCPEAFKVGEILGKAFDSLKYAQDGDEIGDRYLPPSGVVIPPLV
jgi:hypothetical protein